MTSVGLIVNPAAGRDIRRLTGGASVVDNYAKRRVAECVLVGLTIMSDPPAVEIMPDRAGIANAIVDAAPKAVDIKQIEMNVEQSAADTRKAGAHFRDDVDAVVVLGGDGTSRDVALELGDVPLVSVSTGTNNVVPTPVDGTVAGAAAAVVATGLVDSEEATYRHGKIDVVAEDVTGTQTLTGLAAVGITDRPFVGTRAVIDPSELLGGVVSRAHPTGIGLSCIAGSIEPLAPDEPGGVALRLGDHKTTPQSVRAVIAPGLTTTVGVDSYEPLAWEESATFTVQDGVIGADGERELELVNADVEMTPVADGPRLVDIDATLEAAAKAGVLVRSVTPVEKR